MEKNNKLKILNILGGSKQVVRKVFERLSCYGEKKYKFTNNNKKNEKRFSFLKKIK